MSGGITGHPSTRVRERICRSDGCPRLISDEAAWSIEDVSEFGHATTSTHSRSSLGSRSFQRCKRWVDSLGTPAVDTAILHFVFIAGEVDNCVYGESDSTFRAYQRYLTTPPNADGGRGGLLVGVVDWFDSGVEGYGDGIRNSDN